MNWLLGLHLHRLLATGRGFAFHRIVLHPAAAMFVLGFRRVIAKISNNERSGKNQNDEHRHETFEIFNGFHSCWFLG